MDDVVRSPAGDTAFLVGGGQTGALMREHDWAATPLGPPSTWPQSLRSALSICLNSQAVTCVYWGPELRLLYNDAHIPVLADRHPWALGRPMAEVWPDIAGVLAPQFASVLETGRGFVVKNQPLALVRHGREEETYWFYSFVPVRDESGGVGGIIASAMETTAQVLAERRQAFLLRLSDALRPIEDPVETQAVAARLLGQHLGAARVAYAEDAGDGETVILARNYTDGVPGIEGRYRYADYGEDLVREMRAGRAVVRPDIAGDPALSEAERAAHAALRLGATLNVPLVKGGRLLAILAVHYTAAHAFTPEEVALAQEVAERTWAAVKRARAETELRQSAERFRAIVETATDYAIFTTDPEGRIETWPPGAEAVFGWTAADAVGRPVDVTYTPEDRAAGAPAAERREARERGQAPNVRWHQRKDGSRVFIEGVARPLRGEDGAVTGFVKVGQDVTERRATEDALRASEARLRALNADLERQVTERTHERGRTWSISPDMLSVLDVATGVFDRVNPAWTATLGWSADELEGALFADFVHPDDLAASYEGLEVLKRGDPLLSFENRYRTKAGAYRWVRWVAVPEGGKLYSTTRDVTDEKTQTAELALRTAERDRMWETSPDLMLVIDFAGVFRRVNPAWTEILGYRPEELVGHYVNEFVLPDDHTETTTAYETAAEGGRPRIENRYRHKDGSVRWISWVAAPAGDMTYATGRDVTAEKERAAELDAAQEQLRQSQKTEAMGSLTGGVAHDFNNLLTPIIGSLDRLVTRGVGSEREQRLMAGALESAERAKTLVQRLLAFARRQPLQPVAVDVGALVEGMAHLIGSTLGPTIDVRVALADGLPPAKADANQIEMALLNLAVNARDAMPEGGTLTVAAERVSVRGRNGRNEHHAPPGLRMGHYVRLLVADTGTGMDEATLARAVEPFFSTKGVGRGTGLGLSMVHGLAAQLGGGLTLDSTLGQGTTVALWLPISVEPIDGADQERAAPTPPAASRGRALLVDDEDLVRMSTADMLMDLGFDVLEASSAEDALGLLREGEAVDLLVTDHLMPGMSGAQLVREARTLRPGLPALIVSGYAKADGLPSDLPRLVKPFRVAELAERVNVLMPGTTPAG